MSTYGGRDWIAAGAVWPCLTHDLSWSKSTDEDRVKYIASSIARWTLSFFFSTVLGWHKSDILLQRSKSLFLPLVASTMSSRKRKADTQGGVEDGFSCFAVESQVPQQRQRARYGTQRRQEVRQVRKKRACLRCRLLKIPVRIQNPIYDG
jgi:hypothetical protein